MIDLPQDRRERVRGHLRQILEDDWGEAELMHRVLALSYKADLAVWHSRLALAAIEYLLTGLPKSYGDPSAGQREISGVVLSVGGAGPTDSREAAQDRARRLFHDSSMLVTHVDALMSAEPVRQGGGYIDWEASHLTLLGGRVLLLGVLRVLLDTPWAEPPTRDEPRLLEWQEASYLDLQHHLRPEVIEQALSTAGRAWPDWQRATNASS